MSPIDEWLAPVRSGQARGAGQEYRGSHGNSQQPCVAA